MEGETSARPVYTKSATSVDPKEFSQLSVSPTQRAPFNSKKLHGQSSPHLSGLDVLTKTITHSGNGTHEEVGINERQPTYKNVHLEHVDDLLRPLDPSALTENGSLNIDTQTSRSLKMSSLKPPTSTSSNPPGTTNLKPGSSSKLDMYSTRVSFDTVNVQFYGDSDSSDNDLEDFKYGSKKAQRTVDPSGGWGPEAKVREMSPTGTGSASRGRERLLSPTRIDRKSSPHSRALSPSERSRSPAFFGSPPRKKMDEEDERIYPTTPIITHDACTLTTTHKEFDKLYSGEFKDKTAKLRRRTIMVYISGRQHTWVALDWCCNRLLEDGDTLIVIASISPSMNNVRRTSITSTSLRRTFTNGTSDDYIRRSPAYAKIVTENIMKYLLAILSPNKIVKITIELGVGHTKDVLKDMYSLYSPFMVVTSAKPTRAVSTKSWVTSRITDRLVKNFPVPVVVVPALNMGLFEEKLFESLNTKYELAHKGELDDHHHDELIQNHTYDHNYIREKYGLSNIIDSDEDEDEDEDEDNNDGSDADNELDNSDLSSIDSVKSFESNDSNTAKSIIQIRKATYDANVKLYKELYKIKKRPVDKNTFKDTLDAISTAGYSVGMKLADTAKLGGKGATLVRTLTGAPDVNFGQKKSMLLDDGPSTPPPNNQLRRTLSPTNGGGLRPGDVAIPRISIEPVSRSRSPPPSNAFHGVSAAPRSATSLKFEDELPKLKHTSTTGIDSTLSDHQLSKVKSTPQLYVSKSNNSIAEKKKGGFFKKMFGSKNW